MAELATAPENRPKLTPGASAVTERDGRPTSSDLIDDFDEPFEPPTEFVVPGRDGSPRCSTSPAPSCAGPSGCALVAAAPPSLVVPYLNRLSDLLWTLARWAEEWIVTDPSRLDREEPLMAITFTTARTVPRRDAPPCGVPGSRPPVRCRGRSVRRRGAHESGLRGKVGQHHLVTRP